MELPLPTDATGVLASDSNGLCLVATGAIDSTHSGVAQSLVDSAKRLEGASKSNRSPHIIIETNLRTIAIQQRGDHTVMSTKDLPSS
jgi:hypothetical protein